MPSYISWIQYFSWFRYGNEALAIGQWAGVENISKYKETEIRNLVQNTR